MGCGQPLVLMLMFSRSPPGRSGATLGLRGFGLLRGGNQTAGMIERFR